MSEKHWLKLAKSETVRRRVVDEIALEDFRLVVEAAARRKKLDWIEAIALLHMVYAWMPTMLRPTIAHDSFERARLLRTLNGAMREEPLVAGEIDHVKDFANRSIVGASKILHVLNPNNYAI